jgi:dTDP-4-dehydrorhamnose 3,5-epimerase
VRRIETSLPGLVIIEPVVHGDARGFFLESFREDLLRELGVDEHWRQDNHARSGHGVLRGMHFALPPGQAKLIRCIRGSIVDVCVDIRRGSPTYGRWEAVELDDLAHRMLFVPVGFGHGYCVTSEVADVAYKCTYPYDPALEREFSPFDPQVGIAWPEVTPIVSARDRDAPPLGEIAGDLPFEYAG